jgi:hypothetical protein
MEDLLYDASAEMTQKVIERYPTGQVRPLCVKCHEPLVVVLDEEAMRRTQRHAGLYCPNGHIEVLVELQSVHEGMRGLFERLKHEKPEYADAPVAEVRPDDDGWVSCPGCGLRFTLRDSRFQASPGLWRHSCGQRVRRTSTQ